MQQYVVEWHKEAEKSEKTSDWYWVFGILACAGIIIAFLFDNLLLATIIGLGSVVILLIVHRGPEDIVCRLTHKDITVNETVYPLRHLEAYHIDDKDGAPVLRFTTGEFLMPVVMVHIPEEYIDEIDAHFRAIVPKEHVEEGLSHRLLEIFGI